MRSSRWKSRSRLMPVPRLIFQTCKKKWDRASTALRRTGNRMASGPHRALLGRRVFLSPIDSSLDSFTVYALNSLEHLHDWTTQLGLLLSCGTCRTSPVSRLITLQRAILVIFKPLDTACLADPETIRLCFQTCILRMISSSQSRQQCRPLRLPARV